MEKKIFNATNLVCQFQTTSEKLDNNGCLNGVMSRTDDGFRFEEAVKVKSVKRNPKLYDGKYCSLVHRQDGKYQIHMKTIQANKSLDRSMLAFDVYSEILNAFNVID